MKEIIMKGEFHYLSVTFYYEVKELKSYSVLSRTNYEIHFTDKKERVFRGLISRLACGKKEIEDKIRRVIRMQNWL